MLQAPGPGTINDILRRYNNIRSYDEIEDYFPFIVIIRNKILNPIKIP